MISFKGNRVKGEVVTYAQIVNKLLDPRNGNLGNVGVALVTAAKGGKQ